MLLDRFVGTPLARGSPQGCHVSPAQCDGGVKIVQSLKIATYSCKGLQLQDAFHNGAGCVRHCAGKKENNNPHVVPHQLLAQRNRLGRARHGIPCSLPGLIYPICATIDYRKTSPEIESKNLPEVSLWQVSASSRRQSIKPISLPSG